MQNQERNQIFDVFKSASVHEVTEFVPLMLQNVTDVKLFQLCEEESSV